ncbi:MAG TPA: hypothetical protein VH589_03830 [Trebonia sp.]|jgi:hypothetical protein
MSATATAAAEPRQGRSGRVRERLRGRWAWPAGYVAAAALFFLCCLRLSGTQPVTSDPATIALQAWDMLHGNWLLTGWSLADVTFYTTELPEYIFVEIFRGLGPADVHVAAALTYTLLVVLASLLAKGRATGREGLVRVLIAAGIMIAPQVGHGVFILLYGPDHTGTGIPVLLIWLVLDRAPRRRWVPVLIGLMLAWTLAGDQVALMTAVVPLALVTLVRAYQNVIQRSEPVWDSWYELSLAAAALLSVPLSSLFVSAVRHFGGYATQHTPNVFSTVESMSTHFWWTVQGVLALFGADFFGMKLNHGTDLAFLHLAGLVLAVTAVAGGVRRFLRTDDMIVGGLTAAVLINLALYMFSRVPVSIWSAREIAFILPAGAALAGRTLAGPAIKRRLLPLLGILGLGYLVALGYGVTRHQRPAEGQDLANWLVAHHLSYGLSGYGFGPTTTLASGGKVQLRQASWHSDRISPGPEEQQASWYDPRQHDANFVVAPVTPEGPDPFSQAQVTRIFGQPAHVYPVGSQFIVMTYDYNLLDRSPGA